MAWIDEVDLVAGSVGWVSIIQHPGGTRIYNVLAYDSTSNYDIVLQTYTCDSDGLNITLLDSATLVSGNNDADKIDFLLQKHITGNIFAFVYPDNTSDQTQISTYDVAMDGTIGSLIDTVDGGVVLTQAHTFENIKDTYYLVAGTYPATSDWLWTFPIDAAGNIGAFVENYEWGAGSFFFQGSVKVADNILMFHLANTTGDANTLYTLEFSDAGAFVSPHGILACNPSGGVCLLACVLEKIGSDGTGDIYAMFRDNALNNGNLSIWTVHVNTSTWEMTKIDEDVYEATGMGNNLDAHRPMSSLAFGTTGVLLYSAYAPVATGITTGHLAPFAFDTSGNYVGIIDLKEDANEAPWPAPAVQIVDISGATGYYICTSLKATDKAIHTWSFTLPVDHTHTPSDTLTLADSLAAAMGYARALTDALTITEGATHAVGQNPTENVAIVDSMAYKRRLYLSTPSLGRVKTLEVFTRGSKGIKNG